MATSSPSARGRRPRRPRSKPTTSTTTSASSSSTRQPSTASQLVAAIRRDDFATLSSLLQTPELDVNRRTPQGDAPLVEACRYARVAMATALLAAPHVNANVTSSNRSAGLTPLVAACMALAPHVVALLLQKSVDLLKTFGRVDAAAVCLLFCEANGRSDAQNDAALQILTQLLDYAQEHDQLQTLLDARPDKVNGLVHVAAGLGNWKALQLLRGFGADLSARNAAEHSALGVVELNAFQARSLQFCEPPRAQADAGTGRGRNNRKRHKKQQEEETEQTEDQELQSEADKQTFTRSRPDRAVEAFHVTRTVLELTKDSGVGAVFSRKGDEGVRGLYIKALVLTEVGLVPILNEIAQMADTQKEKAVYTDGLMYTVTSVYPLAVKNAKEYQSLWRQALDKRTSDKLEVNDAAQGDEEEKKSVPRTLGLSHEAFKMVLNGMLSHDSLSRRVKVWTLILMHLLDPYAGASPLTADKRPIMEECGQLQFFERITEMIYRSGTKLAFCIFDRNDIEEDESYDEEIEFHLHVLISLTELFLQFFAPYARTIRSRDNVKVLGISESFQLAIKPVKQLWILVNAALGSLDDAIATPQRFSLLLHLLQVIEQLEAAFVLDEHATLTKLFGIMNRFVKKEANKKRIKMVITEQTQLLHTIATSFPIPSTFTDKAIPLKDSVDMLIRSDPKVLGMDLYSLASIPGLIRLEHKVDYLAMLAEERNGSVSVSISRASEANYVDFILQQILSTSAGNLKGEMNITLVNEPGVGVGVTREFFQIVQRCFFSTTGSQVHASTAKPAPHVLEIGAQWLQLARSQSPRNNKKRSDNEKESRAKRGRPTRSGGFAELFPLFEFVDKQRCGVVTIASRSVYVSKQVIETKRKEKSLSLTQKDLLVDSSEVDALKKVYLCIGRLMGLAIRNHQPLAADFPLVFWRFMMRDGSLSWEDYCENSDVFKRSLQFVLDHDFDAEPLDMRFEYTMDVVVVDEEADAKQSAEDSGSTASNSPVTTSMEMELQKGMGDVEVTNANKAQYVMLRAQQYFFGNELTYYQKIRDGFTDTVVKSDLKLFRPEELRHLVRGERTIDFVGLKKSVVYSRGMSPSRRVIQDFWEIAESFDQETRSKLLTFWSGSPLPPIFGFDSKYRSMNADTACWYIDVDTQMKASFCPMANTCDRRLILPDYPTSAALKEKLLVALEHGSVGYDRM
ncbi:hypothetical protein PF007_g12132 [Phytophthora fragariae]|uniref:HECT-type E3 ubiquitin transferase n=1 Tax=Phytophthora fragariae TaxID=53985 RepID=A0A6A3SAJ0_9STRA|nr:hypothetical protein PF007_g12132 [Phytophthora fragariae]